MLGLLDKCENSMPRWNFLVDSRPFLKNLKNPAALTLTFRRPLLL